jgi:hypothetical protein
MKRLIVVVILTFSIPLAAEAGGEKEEVSLERAQYLVQEGIFVPPEDVDISSYVSHIDYSFPLPDSEVGVTLYAGHRQVSTHGQEEILQIGIQGGETAYEDLPPMNLAILIDKSASMRDVNKYDWVEDSFDIFINRIRDIDFVSLVIFDERVRSSFSPSRMDSQSRGARYMKRVHNTRLCCGTNLTKALRHAYEQVQSNYSEDYINRVILLSDGIGIADGALKLAQDYCKRGIHLSTIGYGTQLNLPLMVELADVGGGSSRFISGRGEMEETFGSDFDRMVVPVARNLDLELEFLQEVEILDTWGYDYRIEGNIIRYFLPTLHNGDYETILIQIRTPPGVSAGMKNLARVSLTYSDIKGMKHDSEPHYLSSNYVSVESPVLGFTDAMVLRSGSMLHFAQALKEIGGLVRSARWESERITKLLRDMYWGNIFEEWLAIRTAVTNREKEYTKKISAAYTLTSGIREELLNAGIRLESEAFTDEIDILDTYMSNLSQLLVQLGVEVPLEVVAKITEKVEERSLEEHVHNLFREMTLDVEARGPGTIVVAGFAGRNDDLCELLAFLNERAMTEIKKYESMQIVERVKLDMVMEEHGLSPGNLMDTTKAIQVGKLLTADRILTGTVIETNSSIAIFGRIVNVETGEVESAAQVVVPTDKVREALL